LDLNRKYIAHISIGLYITELKNEKFNHTYFDINHISIFRCS